MIKTYKKIGAVVLSAAMIASLCSCGQTKAVSNGDNAETVSTQEEDGDLSDTLAEAAGVSSSTDAGKEETVYVITDASGKQSKVIVSEWLKNGGVSGDIKDVSELTDIKNVKGDEEYKAGSDNAITWDNAGNDIYYQGTTDKETPVDIKVTYTLDGEEISPEDLAGKSGKVVIRYDYTNKSKEDGVFTPFLMATGMILDPEVFSNIEVTNGKLVSDGSKQIVVGVALPGLSESLDLDNEDVTIPEFFEVSADATDFSLGMSMTFATTGVLGALNEDGEYDADDVEDEIDNKIGEFTDGITALTDGVKEYTDGVSKLDGYLSTASDGASKLSSSTVLLSDKLTKASEGADNLVSYYEGKDGLVAGAASLADNMSKLNTAVSGITMPSLTPTDDQKQAAQTIIVNNITTNLSSQETVATLTTNITNGITNNLQAALVAYLTANGMNPADIATDEKTAAAAATFQSAYQAAYQSAYKSGYIDSYKTAYPAGYQTATDNTLKMVGDKLSGFTTTLGSLQTSVSKLSVGASRISTGVNGLYDGTCDLQSGLSQLSSGASTLSTKMGDLSSATNQMSEGAKTLTANNDKLVDGTNTLKDGTDKIIDKAETFSDKLEKVVKAGDNYQSFAGKSDDVSGSVKFIFKTEAISK